MTIRAGHVQGAGGDLWPAYERVTPQVRPRPARHVGQRRDAWIAAVEADDEPDLHSFSTDRTRDNAAATNGLSMPRSAGAARPAAATARTPAAGRPHEPVLAWPARPGSGRRSDSNVSDRGGDGRWAPCRRPARVAAQPGSRLIAGLLRRVSGSGQLSTESCETDGLGSSVSSHTAL